MNDPSRHTLVAPTRSRPLGEELTIAVTTALPLTPEQFGARLIKEQWPQVIDPQCALLVTLDYNYRGHPAQNGIQQGQVISSQTLSQALLSNYQTVADGRFGETAFGLYTPPDVGPSVRIVEHVDALADQGSGNHDTYEGIYQPTEPQTYAPGTQLAIRPADFKQWVWELGLHSRYQAYLDLAWPGDKRLLQPAPYPLRTSTKAAFVLGACLQYQEGSLSRQGLALAMQSAGLPVDQAWAGLTSGQLQGATSIVQQVEVGRLTIYRYTSTDLWCFHHRSSGRVLLYIPGNSSPVQEFEDFQHLREWMVVQGRSPHTRQALAAHFCNDDREDGTFHAGVLTALEGMSIYPRRHRRSAQAGFFNDDGYWDPRDYIDVMRAFAGTDPFAQLVLTMKRAAMASVNSIRDDAQVNRDNLNAVVEPLVRWINQFGPLALFVPGGEGLLVLAGLLDAGYGVDQTFNGDTAEQRSEGITRTVFGLLNALPLAGPLVALKGEEAIAGTLAETLSEPDGIEHEPSPTRPTDAARPETPAATPRLELLRGACAQFGAFTDEMLEQIARITDVDDDTLRLMQAGRAPTPLLADTISRFKFDQGLATITDPVARTEQFNSRYQASQHSEHQWVQVFQREYPGLPKTVVEQFLDRSGITIENPIDAGEMLQAFRRLDGKARQYQQHVRLNRAYESLYLHSITDRGSDALAFHSLPRLPGWPKDLRLEMLEGSFSGRVVDRCGPLDAPHCRRLIRLGDRYSRPELDPSLAEGTDLFTAILGVLSADERAALALPSQGQARAFRLSIGEHALSRAELTQGLRRMDSGLPFEAHGLRGGGYPSTPQGNALAHLTLRLQLKTIYPDFTDVQADALLQSFGHGAQAHVDGLKLQLEQLQLDLDDFIDRTAADLEDMDIDFLDRGHEDAADMTAAQIAAHNIELAQHVLEFERQTRSDLADTLLAVWQKHPPHANHVYADGLYAGYALHLDYEDFHRMPSINVRFDDVIELSMRGLHVLERETLHGFLDGFPNLRSLNLERVDLRVFLDDGTPQCVLPSAILRMPRLETLNLKSTFLHFEENTAAQLGGLPRLHTLDLSENPLSLPPVVLGMKELRVLNLSNTGIRHCPVGIADQPYLTSLDLRGNRISRLPTAVLNQAIDRDRVLLWGNPLTDEDTLIRLVKHRERTGLNLWLNQPGANYGGATPWLKEGDELIRTARREIWQRVAAKPSGGPFLRVMDGLSLTADFQVGYWLLQARVWRLLREADASQELWGWLRQRVETTVADADNPFRLFGLLEDRVRLYRDWVSMGRPIPAPLSLEP